MYAGTVSVRVKNIIATNHVRMNTVIFVALHLPWQVKARKTAQHAQKIVVAPQVKHVPIPFGSMGALGAVSVAGRILATTLRRH